MKPTVYLDATIPSFYYEDRPGTVIQAWREITVEFWDRAREDYELVISDETLRELHDIGYPEAKREKCLQLVQPLSHLRLAPEVEELAAYFVKEGAMPANDVGDAFHLAFATWFRIEYLLTWNCKHLANANKFEHIRVLTSRRRLVAPALVTPQQLLGIFP